MPPQTTPYQRLYDRIDFTPECWVFKGKLTPSGYARVRWGDRYVYVHRIVFGIFSGEVPEGLELDHLCRNRACCRPEHLEAVTASVNVRRGIGPAAINAAKDHCSRGHAYSEDNTVWLKRGRRDCRECQRIRFTKANWKRRGPPKKYA